MMLMPRVVADRLKARMQSPDGQRHLVLVIVCTALLLDNMLYMVIVPIAPEVLGNLNATHMAEHLRTKSNYTLIKNKWVPSVNSSQRVHNKKEHEKIRDIGEFKVHTLRIDPSSTTIGMLFAFKAIVQLFVNPISGTVIDRIGYDMPMMIGLSVIFLSTTMFAFASSYGMIFFARGLQGVGSAFADTAGFAMIADRYKKDEERTKSLGIALAFVSFGCLVGPPFGGILYDICGKEGPFIILAFIALLDGYLMFFVMQPVRIERMVRKAEGNLPQATPIWRLFLDPFVLICAGTLAVCNVSLAFIEPTIATWMEQKLEASTTQAGLIWFPAFLPHVLGVVLTVKLAGKYPKKQWLMAAVGLVIIALSCLLLPFCPNYVVLMIPISVMCFGVALVDTAILPTMAYIVDTRHVSIYGSVYAIADISYSLAYAIGPIVAGGLYLTLGFTILNIVIFVVTISYAPVLYLLRNIYQGPLNIDQQPLTDGPSEKSMMVNGFPQQPGVEYGGYNQDELNAYYGAGNASTYSTYNQQQQQQPPQHYMAVDSSVQQAGYGY